uniref:Uncharacterized protein n=1 Tax=Octopus bimaculoides TaxID=37653 RepID=A0A0L8H7H1_OCTBM
MMRYLLDRATVYRRITNPFELVLWIGPLIHRRLNTRSNTRYEAGWKPAHFASFFTRNGKGFNEGPTFNPLSKKT